MSYQFGKLLSGAGAGSLIKAAAQTFTDRAKEFQEVKTEHAWSQ